MDINLEDLLCEECDYEELRSALNNLTEDEKQLIDFIYSTANLKKKVTLKKILNHMNLHCNQI
jgi:predicted nucleotidyltransferase